MINQNLLQEANSHIILPGYKPEDYLTFGTDVAVRIAKMIAKEYFHLRKINNFK